MASPRVVPVIGLVGGVGSGKSSLANRLKSRRSIAVISGDAAGHHALKDPLIKDRIRQEFGEAIFDENGEIVRSALGRLVFGESPTKRQARTELEKIVHPRIREEFTEQIEHARASDRFEAVFLDAAILLEAGWNDLCDSVVFVDTPFAQRCRRVAESRGWDAATLKQRESSQWRLDRKRRLADFTIDNSHNLDDAARQLEQVLNLARDPTRSHDPDTLV